MQLLTPDEVLKAIQDGKQVEVKFGEHYDWEYVLPHRMILEELINPEHQFRLPQQYICVGDVEFPKPETEPLSAKIRYYLPYLLNPDIPLMTIWDDVGVDYKHLKLGMIHLSEENAIAHAKALIKLGGGSYE